MQRYLLLFTALTCLGCAPAGQLNRFYFGMNKPTGGVVGDREFDRFLQQEVSPGFPNLTVLAATGQWQGANGKIERENSRVVEIICDDTPENRDKVAAIAAKYKALFAQEAVMVLKSRPEIIFY